MNNNKNIDPDKKTPKFKEKLFNDTKIKDKTNYKDSRIKEINDLKKQISNLKMECEKYRTSHEKMLSLAENHSYIERQKRNLENKIKDANYDLAKAVLVPVEWMELTLKNTPNNKENSWLKGLEFIINKFNETLKSFGVREINIKKGDNYDPQLAEVVDTIKVEGVKPNCIVKIQKKGYYFYDRVLQHARVIISK